MKLLLSRTLFSDHALYSQEQYFINVATTTGSTTEYLLAATYSFLLMYKHGCKMPSCICPRQTEMTVPLKYVRKTNGKK